MKKFLLAVGFLLMIVSISMQRDVLLSIDLKDATFTVYSNGGIEQVYDYNATDFSLLQLDAYALRMDAKNCDNTLNVVRRHLGLRAIGVEHVGDITIYYEYSYYLPKVEFKSGKRYNIMIAILKDKITIGYPVIAGSY